MTRANRITIQSADNGFKGTFYRTHKMLVCISSADTTWKANPDANSTTNRESFRTWLTSNAGEYGIEWLPELQTQAWDRKYNVYMTDEQVAEDALALVQSAIYRLADKGRHQMEICEIEVVAITAKKSNLSYVEDGKYSKNQAWCVADIEISITAEVYGQQMDMAYQMEMKSGQICKPKTTIAEWNEMVSKEMELNGIEIPSKEDAKTA